MTITKEVEDSFKEYTEAVLKNCQALSEGLQQTRETTSNQIGELLDIQKKMMNRIIALESRVREIEGREWT